MGFSITMATVNIFSDAHHKFVCAEQNNSTVCNRGAAGPWEAFKAECVGNGNYTFKSHHGRYLVSEPNGQVSANRDNAGPWETWHAQNNGDGTVSFRSHHGKWLCAEGNGKLIADRGQVGAWEKFRVLLLLDKSSPSKELTANTWLLKEIKRLLMLTETMLVLGRNGTLKLVKMEVLL